MLTKVIRNSIKLHTQIIRINKMNFVFKDLDYPQEFYKIYDIGLEENYFKDTTSKINIFIKDLNYDDAISEYNLFIHNLETYLDLNKTISLKILSEHNIRLAKIYFDSKNINGSISTIEKTYNLINSNDLIKKENTLYLKLNEKLEDLLATVYKYQVENLDFLNEEYSNLSELKFQQKFNLIAIKLIEMRENHSKNKLTHKPVIELNKSILLKIINISPYTIYDSEFNIISKYCLEKADALNDKEINSNICYRFLKHKNDQTKLNSLIDEIYEYYIKNKKEKVNDYNIDVMLVLFSSINQYVNSFPLDNKILNIIRDIMTPKESESIFNPRNFKFYNIHKFKIIMSLNQEESEYEKYKLTYNLINNV